VSIVSRVWRLCGWTPVGKEVQIRIEESELSSLVGETLSARVAALDRSGSATLELTEPIESGGRSIKFVVAHPRHSGYDFFHIASAFIAADLSPWSEEPGATTQDARFATGLIKARPGRGRT
jgi:hypothetical protein